MARLLLLTTLSLVSSVFFIVGTSSAAAKKKTADKPDAAAAAVETVLRAEAAGHIDRRGQLADVLNLQPDSARARWQAGYVRHADWWRSFDDSHSAQQDADLLERYRVRRDHAENSYGDQMKLAEWCRKEKLPDQERAHLTAALALAPGEEQAAILPRLGYARIGNQWVSAEQFAEWQDMNRRTAVALKTWGPKLERIGEKLAGSRRQHETGLTNLKELASSDSLPAIEYILCGKNEASALGAVQAFEKVTGYQGTLALARQAVFSKWAGVRERATASLKTRRFDEFVPGLIGLLSSPVTATYSVAQLYYFQDRPGDTSPCGFVLVWNYVLARETDDQFQVAVLNAADYRLNYFMRGAILNSLDLMGAQTGYWYSKQGMLTGVPRDPISFSTDRYAIGSLLQDGLDAEEAGRSDANRAYLREREVEAINQRTEELNGRVIAVLATVTGRESIGDPAAWWQWWSDYSDTPQVGAKPVVTVVTEDEVLGDPTLRFNRVSGRCCCLAAGTPVWTDQGPVAIESITIGDRVLAQDIETGGLTFKPVLQTTVRPPTELMTLRFGNESVVCTGGHRFWNSGKGWIRAREFDSQALLHTVTGNTPVRLTKKGDTAKTYNLVVADLHTYFVGKTGVLCQDLLTPRGTNCVVPGLSQTQAAAPK